MLSDRAHIVTLVVMLGSFLLAGVGTPSPASAELAVQPRFIVEEEYSDNYFLSQTHEVPVWQTRASPGIAINGLTERSRLDLDYTFSYFWHRTDRNDVDMSKQNYAGHDLSLLGSYLIGTRVTLGLTEQYILTREPAASDALSNIIDRNRFWRNRVAPFISYDMAQWGEVKISYRKERLEWLEQDPDQENSSENRVVLAVTHHLNTTNQAELEGQVWKRDNGGTLSDYVAYQGKLILRHEFNSLVSGQAGVGYQERHFQQSGLGNWGEPILQVGLKGATERSKLSLFLQRNLVDYTIGNDYFKAYRGELSAEHVAFDVIRGYAGGYYQTSIYKFSPREDHTVSGHVGLGYRFVRDIFELGVEYGYTDRSSNESGRGYEENRVFLRFTTLYDVGSK